jgi:hypothetical protein
MPRSIGTRLAVAAMMVLVVVAGAPYSAAGQTTDETTGQTTETTAPEQKTLTVNVAGDGGGQVTISPSGIECTSTCSQDFDEDTFVELEASSDDSSVFAGWGGACSGSDSSCGVTVDEDTEVTATFEAMTTGSPPPPVAPPPGPPPPGPPPGPQPPGALFDEVDRMIRRLEVANIVFTVPEDTLTVGDTEVVQLLLSAQQPIRRLKRQITALGRREGARIRVSDQMEARLTGPKFKILEVTPAVQAVSGRRVTEWKWDIEPTEAGTHSLHLTLSAIIQVRGSDRTFTVETFDEEIPVRVTLMSRVSGFVEDNWQWLWTAILIPLVAWFLAKRKQKQKPQPPQPTP